MELFAFYPAAQVVATLGMYYPTLGLDALQVERLQGYLFWVALEFVVPTALFGGPTGQLLGPAAGGLLVNRSVNDWINGRLLGAQALGWLRHVGCLLLHRNAWG